MPLGPKDSTKVVMLAQLEHLLTELAHILHIFGHGINVNALGSWPSISQRLLSIIYLNELCYKKTDINER